ncbi:hypothetical protein BDN70DRAFT_931885 [Pholiota conissans]|uniref:Uncharacterized protein n=1 Tax=Pholiota conissans TaxID=109636 RepID=A0A9P5Z584_9AGAR|nr:hypothetical protein BDN70DRAFT_931885 [Pholiota conissans]
MASIYKVSPRPNAALSTTTLYIPQEIIDLIVTILSPKTTALRACSELSIAFHISTRRFSFARIEIPLHDPKSLARRMSKLRKTLKGKPHLLSEIACLKVMLPDYRRASESAWKWVFSSANEDTRWVLQKIAASSSSSSLSSSHSARVRSLEICGGEIAPGKNHTAVWNGVSPFFNRSIAPLLFSIAQTHPHLESLTLSSVYHIPISILNRTNCKMSRSITHLSSTLSSFRQRDDSEISGGKYLQDLRRLELYIGSPPFDSNLTPFALPKLEDISIAIPTCWYHLGVAVEFLKKYSASLTTLRLVVELHSFNKDTFKRLGPSRSTPNPGDLTHLKNMLFVANIYATDFDLQSEYLNIRGAMYFISSGLSYLPLPTTLESITFDVTLTADIIAADGGLTGIVNRFHRALRILDDRLCKMGCCGLKSLRFRLTIRGVPEEEDGVPTLVSGGEALPRLASMAPALVVTTELRCVLN